MPGEKEINCNLFDQLTLLERLEIAAKQDRAQTVLDQIAFEKRAIERKLYQQPLLSSNKLKSRRNPVFICGFAELQEVFR